MSKLSVNETGFFFLPCFFSLHALCNLNVHSVGLWLKWALEGCRFVRRFKYVAAFKGPRFLRRSRGGNCSGVLPLQESCFCNYSELPSGVFLLLASYTSAHRHPFVGIYQVGVYRDGGVVMNQLQLKNWHLHRQCVLQELEERLTTPKQFECPVVLIND